MLLLQWIDPPLQGTRPQRIDVICNIGDERSIIGPKPSAMRGSGLHHHRIRCVRAAKPRTVCPLAHADAREDIARAWQHHHWANSGASCPGCAECCRRPLEGQHPGSVDTATEQTTGAIGALKSAVQRQLAFETTLLVGVRMWRKQGATGGCSGRSRHHQLVKVPCDGPTDCSSGWCSSSSTRWSP